MTRILAFSVTASVLMAFVAPSALAQKSEYFLMGTGANRLTVVQGGAVVRQWAGVAGSDESSIAVSDIVRTNSFGASGGAGYTLGGTDTGERYPKPGGIGAFYDSTTDGKSNYIVQFGTNIGDVYSTDLEYGNLTKLFTAPDAVAWLGITYDASNNSLWLSNWGATRIANFDMAGNLLGEFAPVSSLNSALALDPADGTLWVNDRAVDGRYLNYDKAGNLLGEMTIDAIGNDNTLGGEFAVVPEPASALLLVLGGLAAFRRRRS